MRLDFTVQWSMDNCNGGTTWVEMGSLPDGRFRSDVNIIQTQRREMMSKLLQSEIEELKIRIAVVCLLDTLRDKITYVIIS